MAEAVVNHLGKSRFCAYSAAAEPAGEVDPCALHVLQQGGYSTQELQLALAPFYRAESSSP
jgi:protein-tyrosine-phosphatase